MQLEIVYDNNAEPGFASGWGFSCLLAGSVLFDCGEKGRPLLANLRRLEADPENIRCVMISHDHWDHTGGLKNLLKKRPGLRVYGCPGFGPRFFRAVTAMGGRPVIAEPGMEVAPGLISSGEVPGIYKGLPMPEQALIAKMETGLAVITGCSHPGILNMVAAARRLEPNLPVSLVLGGFHLKDRPAGEILQVAEKLKTLPVHRVGPTHCTGEPAGKIFKQTFGDHCLRIAAGQSLKI